MDTVRTISDILTLLADNTSGDISPQDIRDLVVSLEALNPAIPVSASLITHSIGTGSFYLYGYYDCPAADSNLTQASTTQAYGTANSSYAAHAIVVAAAAGVTDGSDLVLTVTGTSITDGGVRTASDSEIVVADCASSATDQYYETSKKWLGTVTYTLTSSGGAAYNYDFNYGFATYNDVGNTDFDIKAINFEWLGGATDTGFNITVSKHSSLGWTYHATAFVAGGATLYDLATDHGPEDNIVTGEYGKWRRVGLSDSVDGSGSEGLIVNITTTVNNSIEWLNAVVAVRRMPS